jgi:recombination protein RecR
MEKNSEFEKLIEFFKTFPGVGSRQAKRFALFILSKNNDSISDFKNLLTELKSISKECSSCMKRHFSKTSNLCDICSNQNRNPKLLLVTEKEGDIEAFERAHIFDGKYFVLGNLISLISKEEIRLTKLVKLIEKIKKESFIEEITLAFPTTPNGLFTDEYVREEIKKQFSNINIKSLGRGFATGSDPEYVDIDTITYAFKNRAE